VTAGRNPSVAVTGRYRAIRFVNRFLIRLLWRVRAEGLDNWPEPPFCLVVNHHNAWDSQIVMAVTPTAPRITWFGPRTDDFSKGLINRIVAQSGVAIPIRRDGSDLISAARTARQLLRDGGVLGIFPEGHAGYHESKVLPFEDGAVAFAAAAEAPLVPCAIVGANRLWWRAPITVRSGSPIATVGRTGKEQRAALENEIREALIRLLPVEEPPLPRRRPLERFLTTVLEGDSERAERRDQQGL
jgi:1-acyl-sn-glycerol-3-phosphate acyltransferase